MALYRPVQTTFWHDVKVLEEMTPEDKLFYLYLLTNPHTKQIGVYPISKKTMAYEIGYSPESINSLLDRFERHHQLVRYNPETRELAIVNWGKYNFPRAGTPIENCVSKELSEVKDTSLLHLIYPHIVNEKIKSMYAAFLGITEDSSQLPSRSPSRGEKEKEKEKEKENKKNTSRHKFETCDMDNATLLFNLMVINNPTVKEPNFDKWANDMRLLREKDNRTTEQIEYLVKWSQQDEFWKMNILSPSKLREKWDQLQVKATHEHKKRTGKVRVPVDNGHMKYEEVKEYGF